jgi:hypothetical protein
MSYLGNSPELNTYAVGVEKFNGTGACTQFTLTRSIDDPNYLEVVVGGVQQTPRDAYTVTAGVITFTTPPSLGTNNVVIIYRTGTTIAYNQISPSQLLANSVTATALAPNSVTNSKIASNAITGDKFADNIITSNNIVVGAITTNLVASRAVAGNQIGLNAITTNLVASGAVAGNQIGLNAITTNLIATGAVSGNQIGLGAVSGNNIGLNSINASNSIVALSITGNLIGTGAISGNNFAGGGVGSDSLAQNLTLSTIRVAETVNVQTTPISGNYNIHVAEATAYYFVANATGSVTFNLIGNQSTSLNSLLNVGQTASLAIALKQGSTRYRANVFIDGVNPLTSVFWMGASQPAQLAAQTQSIDTYNITVIKIGSSAYTVMIGNTTYSYANNQGMGPGGVQ